MKINRLPKQFRNGELTANDSVNRNTKVVLRREFVDAQEQLADQAKKLIRTYPTQTLIVGFLIGAVVAILIRKTR